MQAIDTIQALGEQVRAERKNQALTQAELAALSGVGVRFIRELEQGKDSCRIGLVFQVLATLGLSIAVYGRGETMS